MIGGTKGEKERESGKFIFEKRRRGKMVTRWPREGTKRRRGGGRRQKLKVKKIFLKKEWEKKKDSHMVGGEMKGEEQNTEDGEADGHGVCFLKKKLTNAISIFEVPKIDYFKSKVFKEIFLKKLQKPGITTTYSILSLNIDFLW